MILRARIRVQGNFAEYVPIALILFLFVEMQGWPRWLVHGLCVVLLAARVAACLRRRAGAGGHPACAPPA